jgi:hypothetical protein
MRDAPDIRGGLMVGSRPSLSQHTREPCTLATAPQSCASVRQRIIHRDGTPDDRSGRHAECLVEDLCFSVRLSAVWSGLGPWKLDVLEC